MSSETKGVTKVPSPFIINADYTELIPRVLNEIGIELNTTELNVSHDAPTLQTTLTYTVTWDDDEDTEEKYTKAVNDAYAAYVVEKKKKKPIRASGKRVVEKKKEKVEKIVKKPVEKTEEKSEETSTASALSTPTSKTEQSVMESTKKTTTSIPSESGTSSDVSTGSSVNKKKSGQPPVAATVESTGLCKDCKVKRAVADASPPSTTSPLRKFTKPARLCTRSRQSLTLRTQPPSEISSSDSNYSGRGIKLVGKPSKSDMSDLSMVTAKLMVIENHEFRGKLRVFSSLATTTSTHISRILPELLSNYTTDNGLTDEQLLKSGNLYYAYKNQDGVSKIRRIHRNDVSNLLFGDLPKIGSNVFLLLDLVGYISNGKRIKLDLHSE